MDEVANSEGENKVVEEQEQEEDEEEESDETLKFEPNLDDRMFDFDDDEYDWGNTDEMNELLGYLRDKPTLLEKFDALLKDINTEKDLDKKERKIRGYKSILRDTVDQLKIRDRLNDEAWSEAEINLEEKEKFLWEQKLNNINSALGEHGVKLDPNNKELYNYLKENLIETFTDKDGGRNLSTNINGYEIGGKKIIQRRKDKTFYGINNKEFINFLERMKKFTASSARSELIDILQDDQNIEITARECIEELREQEKGIIRGAKNRDELIDARVEIGKIEENIDDLKNNKKFNLGRGLIERTLQGRIAKLKLWVNENKTTLGVGGTSLLLSIISGLSTSIPLIEKIKNAAKAAQKIGKGIEKFGKKITKIGNEMDNIFKKPTEAVGAIVGLTGTLFDDLSKIAVPLLGILIVGFILYIINKWIGVF